MTREELRRVRTLTRQLNDLKQRLVSLKYLSTSISSSWRMGIQTRGGTSKIDDILIKMEAVQAEISAAERNLIAAKNELTQKILTAIDDPTAQTLLIIYYVECQSFRKTARVLNYSLRQIFRLHDKILQDVIRCNA